ncbi:MAG: 4Fe-4S dicluster domain-containing protein [Clostridiaceae bacterium]
MSDNFIEQIINAGIVGAGGASFPTHVKLNAKAEYVIVNGAECEPLLRVDQQLMDIYADKIVFALSEVVTHVGAGKGIIALKKKYKSAITRLSKAIELYPKLELFLLDDFYPAGDEQITVYEVLKCIVPEGGIPLNVQAVVINSETLLNVYNSLYEQPVIEKYLTITGAVKNPKTVKVPIGTSLKEILQLAGGTTCDDFTVIDGGPMMGKLLDNTDVVVKKNTKGYIVLPNDHSLVMRKSKRLESMLREGRSACCHCSLCSEICPRNLLGHKIYPDKLMRIASYNSTCDSDIKPTEAFLCSECGLCEHACVMGLQPWKLNKFLKSKLAAAGIRNPNNRKPENASQFREYRKFPIKKLIARLGLEKYNIDAPFTESENHKFNSVKIELRQHIGAGANPVVKVGDVVTKGQLIGDIPEGKMGAKVHASINGTVISVDENSIVIQ